MNSTSSGTQSACGRKRSLIHFAVGICYQGDSVKRFPLRRSCCLNDKYFSISSHHYSAIKHTICSLRLSLSETIINKKNNATILLEEDLKTFGSPCCCDASPALKHIVIHIFIPLLYFIFQLWLGPHSIMQVVAVLHAFGNHPGTQR